MTFEVDKTTQQVGLGTASLGSNDSIVIPNRSSCSRLRTFRRCGRFHLFRHV